MPLAIDDAVSVFWLDPRDLPAGATRVLPLEEQMRVDRSPDVRERQRRAAASVLLRCAVASVGGLEPHEVTVRRRCPHCPVRHGRPELPGSPMHVSVTHAGHRVAVAVNGRGPVGLDVEAPRPRPLSGSLLRRALTLAEREYLLGVPAQRRKGVFLRAWTAKEAILKATGEGLHGGLHRLELDLLAEPVRLRSWAGSTARASTVGLVELDVGDDHVATLATLGAGTVRVADGEGRTLVERMTS